MMAHKLINIFIFQLTQT